MSSSHDDHSGVSTPPMACTPVPEKVAIVTGCASGNVDVQRVVHDNESSTFPWY
jgi:hypothetical protein